MKKIIPILIFVVLTVASCKEDKPKPYENSCTGCQSVSEAKKFFAFKVGSWWVYEEENSGERDSLYVYESSIDPDSYQFNIRIKSEPSGYLYHYWPVFSSGSNTCSETQPNEGKCLFVKKSKGEPGNFIGEGSCFFVTYKVGSYSYATGNPNFDNNQIIVNQVLPEYDTPNYNFDKTIVIHELSTYMEGIQPTNHYYSENVGLVRKELLDSNEVWNLVNYYIAP